MGKCLNKSLGLFSGYEIETMMLKWLECWCKLLGLAGDDEEEPFLDDDEVMSDYELPW